MTRNRWQETTLWLLLLGSLTFAGCSRQPQPGEVLDEARQAGRDGASFTHASEDYFRDMDGALALTPQEVAAPDQPHVAPRDLLRRQRQRAVHVVEVVLACMRE